jgi:hypothetical protein
MHLEFLVEELSAEAALSNILPRVLGEHTFAVHTFAGKPNLLASLPVRLRTYRQWMPRDYGIIVLVDEDREDCVELKHRLEQMAREAGLVTKSQAGSGSACQVMNRLAIEELEAWFLGDVEALTAAYPRVSASFGKNRRYRDPDAVRGGTWEALERLLQRSGYYPGGLPKIETARRISQYMDPARNRSKSFQVFRDGLYEIIRP